MRNQIVIEKENQKYKLYLKSYYLITKSYETNSGADNFFIANSSNGKESGNTKYQNIQEFF